MFYKLNKYLCIRCKTFSICNNKKKAKKIRIFFINAKTNLIISTKKINWNTFLRKRKDAVQQKKKINEQIILIKKYIHVFAPRGNRWQGKWDNLCTYNLK